MAHIQLGSTLASVEREYILDMLARCDGNRTHAAELLDISLRCLRIKLHDYTEAGIEVPSPIHGISRSGKSHHSAEMPAH